MGAQQWHAAPVAAAADSCLTCLLRLPARLPAWHTDLLQLEGLNWLYQGWQGSRNLILADEMGLGKTVQVG